MNREEHYDSYRDISQSGMSSLPARSADLFLGLVASISVLFAASEVITLAASLLGVSISRFFAVFLVVISTGIAVYYWVRLRRNHSPSRRLSSPGRIAIAFAILTLLLYLFLWILAYTLPDFSYDGNYYHSPTIHFWMLKGNVHWIQVGESQHWGPIVAYPWNGYPKSVEVIGYIFLKICGSARLLNSINLLFLPLGGFSIAALAAIFGAPAGFALVAGCLFLFIPINLAQSLTAMVDTASAACYLAFFALLLGTVRRIDRGVSPLPFCFGLAAALGLAAGSKGTGPILVAAGALVLAIRVVTSRRKERQSRGSDNPFRAPSRRALFSLVAAFIFAIALGGFWQLRNWIHTGNPLYPVEVSMGGHRIFDGVDISRQFKPPYREGTKEWNQPERILSNWMSCLHLGDVRNYVYDSRWGGLGFVWLLSIPAVVWLIFIRLKQKRGSPAGPETRYLPDLVFICLVMFFAMPHNHNHMSRYTIWLVGLGLPCLAAVAGRMAVSGEKIKRFRLIGYTWFGVVSMLGAWEAFFSISMHSSFIESFRGGEDKVPVLSSILSAAQAPYPVGYRWGDFNGSILEMILAGDEPVAVAIQEKNQRHLIFGHLVQGPALGKREIVFIDHIRAEEEPKYLPLLIREKSIRYVIWDSTLTLRRELVNGSIRQDYGLGKGLWHVFTFAPSEERAPSSALETGMEFQ